MDTDAGGSKKKKVATSTAASKSTKSDVPWFHFFTKGDEEYNKYMSTEWGFEKRGDEALFEKISLEGAQSGLSWLTILRKREAYRRVFSNFDVDKVALMDDDDVERIVAEESDGDPRSLVVRHRGKIQAVINNAKCIQQMRQEEPDQSDVFDKFLWSFVDNAPILNSWSGDLKQACSNSDESAAMSAALKKRGFRFVGPTTCYSLMQSVGMVIDHPIGTPEYTAATKRLKKRPGGFQDRRKK